MEDTLARSSPPNASFVSASGASTLHLGRFLTLSLLPLLPIFSFLRLKHLRTLIALLLFLLIPNLKLLQLTHFPRILSLLPLLPLLPLVQVVSHTSLMSKLYPNSFNPAKSINYYLFLKTRQKKPWNLDWENFLSFAIILKSSEGLSLLIIDVVIKENRVEERNRSLISRKRVFILIYLAELLFVRFAMCDSNKTFLLILIHFVIA